MNNHTPEPWSLLEAGDSIKHQVPVSSDRTSILTIATEGAIAFGAVYSADDARRIVACVNFCAGVSTENLENNEKLLWLAEQYNTVKTQRDELLTALEEIASCATPYGNRAHSMEKIARAALAKAKGGAS